MPKKILTGIITSNKAQKTIVVSVRDTKMHPLYKKTYSTSKKYHVHNPYEGLNVGDTIKIIECRPYSKTKKWHVLKDGGDLS
jgi:small subunit ribosomal protein S17